MTGKNGELKDRLQFALDLREKKAVDLSKELNIPKSAISQYLSGKSQNMDSDRLYAICKYLNVSEPWLLGYDVPMERKIEKANDYISDIVARLRIDEDFLDLTIEINKLDSERLLLIKQILSTFQK